MTDNSRANRPKDGDANSNNDPDVLDLVSEWQFAQLRLKKLSRKKSLRRELLIVGVLLALVFLVPALLWIHRWTLSGSVQSYSLLVPIIAAAWIWLARLRLVLPEADPIRRYLREQRRVRISAPKIGEREMTVLRVLVEDEPRKDKRSSIPLYFAMFLDLIAFWIKDPTLTYIGFLATAAGIVLFRHGRYAFRAALFPFLLMLAIAPLPGPVNDAIQEKAQTSLLHIVEHMVTNVGASATVPPEGDPLVVTANNHSYPLFVERSGLGISESVFVLLVTIAYLSLIRTPNPIPKLGVLLASMLISAVLIIGRLIFLCWAFVFDRDVELFVEGFSRFLIPVIGIGLVVLVARGLKCSKFHRWVSFSRSF